MAHETDYQRARRQRQEVKKHGVTGSTPQDAAKRIKEHTGAKHKALQSKKETAASHIKRKELKPMYNLPKNDPRQEYHN